MTITIVFVCIAVVLAVGLVVALRAGTRARAAAGEASEQAGSTNGQLVASEKRRGELEAELLAAEAARQADGARRQAQREEESVQRQAETEAMAQREAELEEQLAKASAGSVGGGLDGQAIQAIWSLERLELEAEQRREAAITGGPIEVDAGVLVAGLDREVERIREEMGTPGELRTELREDPDGRAGLLMLRSVRLTLGAMARHCQGFDLTLRPGDHSLEATVVCEGFEPDAAAETSAALDAIALAVASVGGTATFVSADDGPAQAHLSVPVE